MNSLQQWHASVVSITNRKLCKNGDTKWRISIAGYKTRTIKTGSSVETERCYAKKGKGSQVYRWKQEDVTQRKGSQAHRWKQEDVTQKRVVKLTEGNRMMLRQKRVVKLIDGNRMMLRKKRVVKLTQGNRMMLRNKKGSQAHRWQQDDVQSKKLKCQTHRWKQHDLHSKRG
ncbi:hypothetical protein CHS0354_030619 [Potamilus streckersoni]|uniref:Uncharacterized protein n=1 Tax=Potamilus streckersoni TaxID=2493646 RepID=A0AAE0SCR1_9BIVA|nr:hypothetical protein CHS0354_030619 [Potamilus streckersoni]